MSKTLLVGLMLLLVACAGEAVSPFEGTVLTDVDLRLTVADRLAVGFTPGVWTAERDSDLVTLRETHFVGDEGGVNRSLVLDFSQDPPAVVSGAIEHYDAYAEDRTVIVENGVVELQHADPDGVIAGRWIGETDATMTFWVDLADHTFVDIEVGEPFVLRPGGYALWNESTAFFYGALTEDSRCPADVTCVWEGRLSVEGTVWDIEDQHSVALHGVATDDGPAYGTEPSARFRSGLTITLLAVDDAGLATFVVTQSN